MKTILYVEDDKINALVISKFLESQYHVIIARSFQEALEKVASEPIDLFILDISLGHEDEDGVDLMNRLKELPQGQKKNFIALTAHALKEDQDKYLELGFDAYLAKPINRQLLLDTIAQHFRRS
ncbi:MAG: response regulator [Bacteroidota bacterium]|nr:response regulator [Bacteroidota bacterium]MDX5430835.1 response regulator [Bacteroidota bacterium]MDX5469579.1 response regulator [Bacteroidota bacterium]